MAAAEGVSQTFMEIAEKQRALSNDPKFQTGACLVSEDQRVIGKGYNCMPNKLDNHEKFSWKKRKEARGTLLNKHLYVCHAELNAIVEAVKDGKQIENCTLYTTLFPCNECAKFITQCGIRNVIYKSDEKAAKVEYQASKIIFDATNVRYRSILEIQEEKQAD